MDENEKERLYETQDTGDNMQVLYSVDTFCLPSGPSTLFVYTVDVDLTGGESMEISPLQSFRCMPERFVHITIWRGQLKEKRSFILAACLAKTDWRNGR